MALKGTKSCRTQGDFHSSIRSFVPSVHLSPPGSLRPEICPIRFEICPIRPEIYPLRPEIYLFWAAAPKGTKPCRTQGDFCSSIYLSVRPFVRLPPQALSGLKSALSGLKSTLSGLKSALSSLESALSGLKSALRPAICPHRP